MRTHVVSACMMVSLACLSSVAHAEPVAITGGFGNVGTDVTGFLLTGAQTSISLTVRGSFGPVEFFPGDSVSFTTTIVPEDFSTFGFPVTLNGTDHGNVFLQGLLTFVTGHVIAPPVSPGPYTVSVPGMLSGTLTAFRTSDTTAPPLFAIDVTGEGIFSSVFWEIGPFQHPDHWLAGIEPSAMIRFDQSATAGATPEPASLVLLATGAAGLLARRRAPRR